MKWFLASASVIFCLAIGAPDTSAADSASQPRNAPALIGYLEPYATPGKWFEAFRRGLQDLGYADGRTVVIERRSARGQTARLIDLAKDLVALRPRVIVASAVPGALAAKKATARIPIVMTNTSDPVRLGLVASLSRPEGNVTGLSTLSAGLAGKRLELIASIVPVRDRLGVVGHHASKGGQTAFRELQLAAQALHRPLELFQVRRPKDFDGAFRAAAERVGGVAVMNNPVIRANRSAVVAAAALHKVPALYFDSEIVSAGGLVSYGADIPDLHRRAAIYVDKILRGAQPADLPVERPVKFTLAVNLKTARALGITIPSSILLRADEVIE